jgi:hypothetical protein
MFLNKDLNRSYLHYSHLRSSGLIVSNSLVRFLLSISFVPIIFLVVNNIFFRYKERVGTVAIDYLTKSQPYKTLYSELESVGVGALPLPNIYIPAVPSIFLKDVFIEFRRSPLFVIKNLDFLSAMLIKIFRYYAFFKTNDTKNIIVFQEYSFYLTYFTRVVEYDDSSLYCIQHGIPGHTYCHFRFTFFFTWSEFFKEYYICQGAEQDQFIVSGSIYHQYLLSRKKKTPSIDILYVMQGGIPEHGDIVTTLEKLSNTYRIQVLQHPRYYVEMDSIIQATDKDIISALLNSSVILSHYSTALLDGMTLGLQVISYIYPSSKEFDCISYLEKEHVITNANNLEVALKKLLIQNDTQIVSEHLLCNKKIAKQLISNFINAYD